MNTMKPNCSCLLVKEKIDSDPAFFATLYKNGLLYDYIPSEMTNFFSLSFVACPLSRHRGVEEGPVTCFVLLDLWFWILLDFSWGILQLAVCHSEVRGHYGKGKNIKCVKKADVTAKLNKQQILLVKNLTLGLIS